MSSESTEPGADEHKADITALRTEYEVSQAEFAKASHRRDAYTQLRAFYQDAPDATIDQVTEHFHALGNDVIAYHVQVLVRKYDQVSGTTRQDVFRQEQTETLQQYETTKARMVQAKRALKQAVEQQQVRVEVWHVWRVAFQLSPRPFVL
mgnify:CR=1 FL=1